MTKRLMTRRQQFEAKIAEQIAAFNAKIAKQIQEFEAKEHLLLASSHHRPSTNYQISTDPFMPVLTT